MTHTNKIAFITGGSRGLGRATALKLARDGADIILTYREKQEDGQAVLEEIEALGRSAALLQVDVARTSSFDILARELADLLESKWQRQDFDFLINNAGININAPFDKTTEDGFDQLMGVHFKGVFFLTQKLLPLIAKGGRIVCTSTGLTRFTAPGYAAYACMKGAIEVFIKYLAQDLGPRGITANCVAPGIIETDFTKSTMENPAAKKFFASKIALGRVGVPEDIGGVVSFLCSEEGRWVNAQRVEASGGMML